MPRKIPFLVRIVPLFLLFLFAFLAWYWLMGNLFSNGNYAGAIVVGYSLPVIFVLVAYISSKTKGKGLTALSHFAALGILGLLYVGIALIVPQSKVPLFVPEAVVGIALIAAVMSIMLYPLVELEKYFAYKKLLFIAGVIFMPLFIVIATFGLTVSVPILGELHHAEEKVMKGEFSMEQFFTLATEKLTVPAYVLITALIGFWASAAWLGFSRTQGAYVRGLEIGPMMAFRPDLILPGGVNFVKGVLLTGIGLILMLHEHPVLPRWDWWGFILAFGGIMLLIPIRGLFKMILRRKRLLGDKEVFSRGINFVKEALLFFGLLVLLYGFLNAFRAVAPFTLLLPSLAADWPALIPLAVSFIILVPLRQTYKSRLSEGAEAKGQSFFKQFLLWLGVIILIYSFAFAFRHILHLHTATLNYATNPLDFGVGSFLFILGTILILGVRPFALINEFKALLRIMPGMLSSLPEEKRNEIMERRLDVLASYTDGQRLAHMGPMMEGINALPENERMALRKNMMKAVAKLPEKKRQLIMKTMDKIMFEGR